MHYLFNKFILKFLCFGFVFCFAFSFSLPANAEINNLIINTEDNSHIITEYIYTLFEGVELNCENFAESDKVGIWANPTTYLFSIPCFDTFFDESTTGLSWSGWQTYGQENFIAVEYQNDHADCIGTSTIAICQQREEYVGQNEFSFLELLELPTQFNGTATSALAMIGESVITQTTSLSTFYLSEYLGYILIFIIILGFISLFGIFIKNILKNKKKL